jgi:hypothetical protein
MATKGFRVQVNGDRSHTITAVGTSAPTVTNSFTFRYDDTLSEADLREMLRAAQRYLSRELSKVTSPAGLPTSGTQEE